MDDLPDRLAEKDTFLVTQLATTARQLSSGAFVRAGARGYHYRVLSALDEHGPLSQADLGRLVHMDRSDVVGAATDLAELGQVERAADPTDGRRRMLSITTAGRRQLKRLDRELARAQADFLDPLDEAERRRLHGLLTRLYRHHST